jgi:hypothetical protein
MAKPGDDEQRGENELPKELSSEELAALIVDALIDAGVVAPGDYERAVAVTAEEIDARRLLGDYCGGSPTPPRRK